MWLVVVLDALLWEQLACFVEFDLIVCGAWERAPIPVY
jgi:hypothetical protein